jgi:RecJ-like exonuclease
MSVGAWAVAVGRHVGEMKNETKSGDRCPYCEGTGQVMLLITQKQCRDCGGTGRVQTKVASTVNEGALSRSAVFTTGGMETVTTGGTRVAIVRTGDQKGDQNTLVPSSAVPRVAIFEVSLRSRMLERMLERMSR